MAERKRHSVSIHSFHRSRKALERFCRRRNGIKVWGAGIEWTSGWIAKYLSSLRMVAALEYIGKLGLLGALLLWFYPGCHQRKETADNTKKTKHYVAWQTLNSGIGKPGNGGRSDALMDLNRDGVSLVGVDLSGDAYFPKSLVLTNARISFATFRGSHFESPKFSQANLISSTFASGWCYAGEFDGAALMRISASNFLFFGCEFRSNRFDGAQFTGCQFRYCNFAFAHLEGVKLSGIQFEGCNFAHAKLPAITVDDGDVTRFEHCNLFDAPVNVGFERWIGNRAGIAHVDIRDRKAWLTWVTKTYGTYDYDLDALLQRGLIDRYPSGKK
jgi:hypothetical protein